MKSANALHRRIFKWFKPYMVQLAYEAPTKDNNLLFAFQDHTGKRWFQIKKMPIIRKLAISKAYLPLCTGIAESDISLSLQAIEQAINRKVNGKMQPDIAMVSHICRQLLSRSAFVIDMDALYEMCALFYILEDESIEFINADLTAKKIELLKKEKMENIVIEFFFSQSLDKLFPFLNDFEGTLLEVIEESNREINAFSAQIQAYGR